MNQSDSSLDPLLAGLKAAADPSRLRLLALCARSELGQAELTDILGQSQPRVARHLKILCEAGLLDRFRERQRVLYRLVRKGHGGRLAAALLGQLPADNPELVADRQRLDELRGRQADRLRRLQQGVDGSWPGSISPGDEARVRGTIVNMLSDCRIGALLDIGTGTGRMLRLLGRRAEEAVGVDLSSDMLALARNALEQAGLDHCMVRHADMYKLPFSAGSFDTVTVDQVLEHAEAPARVIAEAARILRPGGNLLVVDRVDGEAEAVESLAARCCRESGLLPSKHRRIGLGAGTLGVLLARRPGSGQEAG